MRLAAIAACGLAALAGARPAAAQLSLEYVAHACFVVESPGGTRIAIDPYSGTRWLGFGFPDDLVVDAVLISHPHYDHDASGYFPERVPVLRAPGRYAIGDVEILGVAGRHADPYGREFGQQNTIWKLATGGLRLVHLGDNGPPSAAALATLGGAELLLLPADGLDHILKPGEAQAWSDGLGAATLVPMHYRHQQIAGLPDSLGPLEPWLEGRSGVVRLESNRLLLRPEPEPAPRVLVFPPRPGLRPWPAPLREAWDRRDAIRAALDESEPEALQQAIAWLRAASAAAPEAMLVRHQLALALVASGDDAAALAELEAALAAAGRDDHEFTLRARALLARLYAAAGRRDEAALQYRLVLRSAERSELREAAEAFLAQR